MGEEQKEKDTDGGSRFGGPWLEAVYIRSDMRGGRGASLHVWSCVV